MPARGDHAGPRLLCGSREGRHLGLRPRRRKRLTRNADRRRPGPHSRRLFRIRDHRRRRQLHPRRESGRSRRARRLDPLQPGRRHELPDRRHLRERRRHRGRYPAGGLARRRQSELRAAVGSQLRQLSQVGLPAVGGLEPRKYGDQRVGPRPVLGHRHAGRRRRLRLPGHSRPRRDGLLRHLPCAHGGHLQPRPDDARRGRRPRGARRRQLRDLPPDGLGRRRQPRRAPLPRQVHLPLPRRLVLLDVRLRLGAARRRHLPRHEGLPLDAARHIARLRGLPPVHQSGHGGAGPEHLPGVGGFVVRDSRSRTAQLPGLPHAGGDRVGAPLHLLPLRPPGQPAAPARLRRLDARHAAEQPLADRHRK